MLTEGLMEHGLRHLQLQLFVFNDWFLGQSTTSGLEMAGNRKRIIYNETVEHKNTEFTCFYTCHTNWCVVVAAKAAWPPESLAPGGLAVRWRPGALVVMPSFPMIFSLASKRGM